MKSVKNYLKPIIFFTIGMLILSIIKQNNILKWEDKIQTNLSQGLRTVKITEEKTKISDNNLDISIKMPQVHYENRNVERYINTYLRKNINKFVNERRQINEISKDTCKYEISINYHVSYEDKNILNIIIYRNINWGKNDFKLEKDSYVFDLNTGQRIYLDNFLKNNADYVDVIKNYINNYTKDNQIKLDKDKVKIDKYTNFYIVDRGINVYFNPYKESCSKFNYDSKN